MVKIKKEKLQIVINVEIGCTEPESFENQQKFQKQDANAMKQYLGKKIKNALQDSWQYAAKVEKVTYKSAKFI